MKNLFVTLFTSVFCVILAGCPATKPDTSDAGAETETTAVVDTSSESDTTDGDTEDVDLGGTETGDGDGDPMLMSVDKQTLVTEIELKR